MNSGRFVKGNVPWNKNKSGYMGPNRTSFRDGHLPHNTLEPGTVSRKVIKRKNRIEIHYTINIDWKGNRKTNNNYRWYLWEVEHQQDRPPGYVLALKNNNSDDIRLENLELITQAENLRRNNPRV